MNKLFLSLAVLILFFIQATFAQPVSNPNAPAFKFKEEVHNFGTIDEGTQATYEFEFTNTGKEPLIIQNVRTSCGCTAPHWPKEPILPGQTGVIKVVYNSKGRPGGFNKTITITSNATTPTKVIYIKGVVKKKPPEPTAPMKEQSIIAEPK